eukprot:CAMPEP_0170416596 /NCGR_PEP_ID=MMETSP0117_2-20130122/33245_1 /TAXON_ID=400756 /ORGANISM="Durinskia baltica, Strain CSIRO CS-38" /LENGTH=199 /DNA_ID=CAMNT_0010674681 /DNA_START=84 /DNA_END=684 /DNA_ORIENTATION=-
MDMCSCEFRSFRGAGLEFFHDANGSRALLRRAPATGMMKSFAPSKRLPLVAKAPPTSASLQRSGANRALRLRRIEAFLELSGGLLTKGVAPQFWQCPIALPLSLHKRTVATANVVGLLDLFKRPPQLLGGAFNMHRLFLESSQQAVMNADFCADHSGPCPNRRHRVGSSLPQAILVCGGSLMQNLPPFMLLMRHCVGGL